VSRSPAVAAEIVAATTVSDQTLGRAEIERLVEAGALVRLVGCDLGEADCSQLELSGWTFERCLLRRTSFRGSQLDGTRWSGCKGGFAEFFAADLTDAQLHSSDFNNANFRSATMSGTVVRGCKLTGADFGEAKTLGATFAESLFVGARLEAVSFRKMTLLGLDFSDADLRKCDFRGAVLDGCSLRAANIGDAHFEGADLRGADLGELRLNDATKFRGAVISRDQAALLLAELGLTVR
jgi:fluoroquinolone resistance protein